MKNTGVLMILHFKSYMKVKSCPELLTEISVNYRILRNNFKQWAKLTFKKIDFVLISAALF